MTSCLALDIGGVLCADTWESLFFTPRIGLVAHYKLDPAMVAEKGEELWGVFAYAMRSEEEYWQSWEKIIARSIDRALVARLYAEAIWADASAAPVITEYLESGRQVALVSNSTSFWFPRQISRLGLEGVEHKFLRFLSHETGFGKTHDKGGLKQLASRINPQDILFIDDRHENVTAAQKLGMSALHYKKDTHKDLAGALKSIS